MLRKRARSTQKDQQMGQITSDGGSDSCLQSDLSGQRQKTNSFFSVPGLFVGLSPKGVSDCDSVRSPTSPLDFKLFSNLGSSIRFPKPCQDGRQKSWDCNKVGLGSIVDSLDEDDRNLTEKEKTIPLSNSKTILFGSQIRSKAPGSPTHAHFCEAPKSLPKNYAIFAHAKLRPSNLQKGSSDVLFEIGEDPLGSDPVGKIQSFSLDSKRLGSEIYRLRAHSLIEDSAIGNNKSASSLRPIASGTGISRSLTPSEIELSEDYTCVIAHGPNPKTTHIFGDCVLESHPSGIDSGNKGQCPETGMTCLEECLEMSSPSPYPSDDFLSSCYFCKKKLDEGKDIYMYRGEKAFCSWDCRMEEIMIEEEKEKSISDAPGESPAPENGDENFEKSIFVAI